MRITTCTQYPNGYDCRPYVKPYSCMAFLFDLIMVVITGGFWLIWIFVREMRRR